MVLNKCGAGTVYEDCEVPFDDSDYEVRTSIHLYSANSYHLPYIQNRFSNMRNMQNYLKKRVESPDPGSKSLLGKPPQLAQAPRPLLY